jgi:hypothetical protein
MLNSTFISTYFVFYSDSRRAFVLRSCVRDPTYVGSRKRPHRSGAICRMWWSGAASGARPRHVRVRVVSRFSALQYCKKRAKILKWRQMRAFSGSVSERGAAVRLLPGSCPVPPSCPVPARRPVPARFLPGSCPVPAQRPVPARFLPLPDGRAGQPPRSDGSCAGAGQQPPHHSFGCCTTRLRSSADAA